MDFDRTLSSEPRYSARKNGARASEFKAAEVHNKESQSDEKPVY